MTAAARPLTSRPRSVVACLAMVGWLLGAGTGLLVFHLSVWLEGLVRAPALPLPAVSIHQLMIGAAFASLAIGVLAPRQLALLLSRRRGQAGNSHLSWVDFSEYPDWSISWTALALISMACALAIVALPAWLGVIRGLYWLLNDAFVWSGPFLTLLVWFTGAAAGLGPLALLGACASGLENIDRGRARAEVLFGWMPLGAAAAWWLVSRVGTIGLLGHLSASLPILAASALAGIFSRPAAHAVETFSARAPARGQRDRRLLTIGPLIAALGAVLAALGWGDAADGYDSRFAAYVLACLAAGAIVAGRVPAAWFGASSFFGKSAVAAGLACGTAAIFGGGNGASAWGCPTAFLLGFAVSSGRAALQGGCELTSVRFLSGLLFLVALAVFAAPGLSGWLGIVALNTMVSLALLLIGAAIIFESRHIAHPMMKVRSALGLHRAS